MNIEQLRDHCLQKKAVEEGFPFGNDTLVFKVAGKIFLLANLHANPFQFNVKCSPDKAIELRIQYSCVLPGYHMNKAHWNTIICNGLAPDKAILGWVNDSYELIVNSLPKRLREELAKV